MRGRKNKYLARKKRKKRVRKKIMGTGGRPRLSLYKSNRYLYAQLIDDENNRTLLFVSSLKDFKERTGSAKNLKICRKLGENLGKQAKDKGITQVVFDRSSYPYQGRIKALAEGARKQGLKF